MYNFIFIIFIIYILFIIIGIIFMIVFKESSMVPALVILTLLAGVMGFFCYEERPHFGVITDIQIIEGTLVSKVIDDEIEYVTEYQYIILIKTEDGEYRTMISELGEDWSYYKEGEMITYTLESTLEIEEE